MQPREKKLAAIVGALAALLLLYLGFVQVSGAFKSRRAKIEALADEVAKKETKQTQGRHFSQLLGEWEARSLPSDKEEAQRLYQHWLIKSADNVKLANVRVNGGKPSNVKGFYDKLPFTMECQGNLDQVTRFMHEFYRSNNLHMLRDVNLTPLQKSKNLDVRFTIEALVLPRADRKNSLAEGVSQRLAFADLKPYQDAIVSRDLFAEYVPPRPPDPPRRNDPPPPTPTPPPVFDAAKFAILTAILEVDAAPEAWLNVKTTGEVIRLREGAKVEVGQFKGTVTRIGVSDVELESAGKRRRLTLGKSLPQSIEL